MILISVPDGVAKKKKSLPPKGRHVGSIYRFTGSEEDGFVITWRFRFVGKRFQMRHEVDLEELLDILVVLGLAGRNVDEADIVGRDARIKVTHFGNKKYAKVTEVHPLGDEQ